MNFEKNKNLLLIVVALVTTAVFLGVAFSNIDFWVKVAMEIIILGVSGTLLGILSGNQHWYGVILIRGVSGFKEMKYIAKHHAELSKALADFGLTLSFGVFYGWRLFGLKKKLLIHFLGMLLFYGVFFLQPVVPDLALAVTLGLVAGLFGIGFFFIADHAYKVLTVPATPPGVIPIIPFITVPWEVIFALIIVMIVHELAHGVLCLIENIKVKHSGLILFGIIPIGAFVEPDEKKMAKAKKLLQLRILGAGSTSNALFFVLFLVIGLLLAQATPFLVKGVVVGTVLQNSTAFSQLTAGEKVLSADGKAIKSTEDLVVPSMKGYLDLKTDQGDKIVRITELEVLSSSNLDLDVHERIYTAGGQPVYTAADLREAIEGKKSGETIFLTTTQGQKAVRLDSNGRLGITLAVRETVDFQNDAYNPFLFGIFSFLMLVIAFTYTLNFILAAINLLPLFLTDGQKIFLIELQDVFGVEKGTKYAVYLGIFTLIVLLINALPWFIKTLPWLS